jgi:hypothetical protein
MTVSGGVGGLREGSAYYAHDPANTHTSSQEQIFSPVVVRKSGNSTRGFEIPDMSPGSTVGTFDGFHVGPTRAELDPYFSAFYLDPTEWAEKVDFIAVSNEKGPETNIRKIPHDSITVAKTTGLRGPIILGGFGTDLADRPVPSASANGMDVFRILPEAPYDRSQWKHGPVDLKWDYERKVWSGGPQIVAGVLVGEITKPETPCSPTTFIMEIYRYDSQTNTGHFSNCHLNEYIEVKNFDASLEQPVAEGMVWVVAARLNYDWVPMWVGCPDPCEIAPDPASDIEKCPEDVASCYCESGTGEGEQEDPRGGGGGGGRV